MNETLCVAVSGLHLGENAQPGPGVIRSLREALGSRLRVIGLGYDALDSSLYAPGLLDESFILPYPSASPTAYLERLLEIDAEVDLDLIVPCLDAELPVLDRLVPALAERGIRCLLPDRDALAARAKERLPELCEKLGLRTPRTRVVLDPGALALLGEELGYPFVVKGPLCDAEVVHGLGQAHGAFHRLAETWGLPVLAQRFVSGDEYNVAALGDGHGGLHGAVAMRKTIVTKLGKAWGAVTVHDPAVLETAERIVRGLCWRGGCEIELIRDRRGNVEVVEVNPRFPAWIYLTTAAGANLPLRLVQLALGREPQKFEGYRAGTFYVRHAVEAIGSMDDLEGITSRGRKSSAPPPPFMQSGTH
ncbi:MAG TPA: ATP-grasp domain-containing protein [Polyangiaceae bacterium]|nr:ATP-grasp domain-containing protein [Polyangiaceae bacterium]